MQCGVIEKRKKKKKDLLPDVSEVQSMKNIEKGKKRKLPATTSPC